MQYQELTNEGVILVLDDRKIYIPNNEVGRKRLKELTTNNQTVYKEILNFWGNEMLEDTTPVIEAEKDIQPSLLDALAETVVDLTYRLTLLEQEGK